MKITMSRRPIGKAFLAILAGLAPIAAANAISPLGFQIPELGTSGPPLESTMNVSAIPTGVSPLGWEIPAPGPRGAQGPVRLGTAEVAPYGWDLNYHLGGIGGFDTN